MSKRCSGWVALSWFLWIVIGHRFALAEGPTYSLVDGRRAGDVAHVKATLQVAGKLHSPSAESADISMTVKGQVAYQDLFKPGSDDRSNQAVRRYEEALAELRVGNQKESTRLLESLSTIVASHQDKGIEFVSPDGSLSRKELDVLALPGDPLTVYRLLPDHPVAEGAQWTHDPDDLAALLNLEHVGVNETKSELVKVENGLAQIRLTGLVKGRASGVATEMRITGDYRYDLNWRHINWLQLRINENRDESPISPGLTVDAELRMLITPQPAGDLAAALQTPIRVPDRNRLLRFESESSGYELLHGRRWHLVDERSRLAAWRIVEDDVVIAQCNAIRLKDLAPGKQLALEEFQADIQKALGDQFGQFEAAIQKQRDDLTQMLRVVVRGVASEVPVRWVYYHVANPQGQRANLVFVMDIENIERFGKDDDVAATSMAITASAEALPKVADEPSATAVETAARAAGEPR
jgi:hypothetical protein